MIRFEFYEVYDPGEFSKLQWHFIESVGAIVPGIPRYKDQIKHNDKMFYVHDVVWKLNGAVTVKCVVEVRRPVRERK